MPQNRSGDAMYNHTDFYREYIIIQSRKSGISTWPSVSIQNIVAIVIFMSEVVMIDDGRFPSTV